MHHYSLGVFRHYKNVYLSSFSLLSLFMVYVNKYGFDDTKIKKLKELVRENLVKATLDQRKETDRLKKYINELTEKQTGIIKKT